MINLMLQHNTQDYTKFIQILSKVCCCISSYISNEQNIYFLNKHNNTMNKVHKHNNTTKMGTTHKVNDNNVNRTYKDNNNSNNQKNKVVTNTSNTEKETQLKSNYTTTNNGTRNKSRSVTSKGNNNNGINEDETVVESNYNYNFRHRDSEIEDTVATMDTEFAPSRINHEKKVSGFTIDKSRYDSEMSKDETVISDPL